MRRSLRKIPVALMVNLVEKVLYNFIGCSKKFVEGQTMEKTELYWKLGLKIDVCVKEPEMAVLDSLERTVCWITDI
jgi:hypothetical protein